MSIGVEITIGDGKDKPKIVKMPNGTYVVRGVLPPAYVRLARALWVRSFKMLEDVNDWKNSIGEANCKDGTGFLISDKGKLTRG